MMFYIIRYFTFFGNIFPQFLICLALSIVELNYALMLGMAWIGGYFTNLIIKNTVRRPRPDPSQHKIHVKGFSFTSGHSFNSLVLYWGIIKIFNPVFHFEPGLCAVLLLMPILLGLTRLYLKVHYISDVLAGWTLGALYLFFVSGKFVQLGSWVLNIIIKSVL